MEHAALVPDTVHTISRDEVMKAACTSHQIAQLNMNMQYSLHEHPFTCALSEDGCRPANAWPSAAAHTHKHMQEEPSKISP